MPNPRISTVAIVGSGVAAWYSAAYLSAFLGASTSIQVIETVSADSSHSACGSLPPIKAFNHRLGISENEFLSVCKATIKLGTEFVNWGQLGNRYFHPYGNYGADFDVVPVHQWWLKELLSNPSCEGIESLSMACALAQEGRFTSPLPDRRMIQSTFDYAYHFDESLYAKLLKARAIQMGVASIAGELGGVDLHPDSGFVTSVKLADGGTCVADLFIDCTGTKADLISGALARKIEDWSKWLACNSVVEVPCANTGDILPFTRCVQRQAGWQWRIPLADKTSHGFVFADGFISKDDAVESLLENLDGSALGEPRFSQFKPGVRKDMFHKNVVAIGASAGWLEPLEGTHIHLIQSALNRLLALWPTTACEAYSADEYNRVSYQEWSLVRDFLVLHYHASTRTDSALWRHYQDMQCPESLQARLAHWVEFGRTISPGPEVFQSDSWVAVALGQGLMPSAWDPLLDAREGLVDSQARLAGLRQLIRQTSAQAPFHRDWLKANS